MRQQPASPQRQNRTQNSPVAASEHTDALQQLLDQHFALAGQRVDAVYRRHFAPARAVFARHWRHRRDIPGDLLALPRTLLGLLHRRPGGIASPSGKQQEMRRILEQELLDLPALEASLQHYCEQIIEHYRLDLADQPTLTPAQRQEFEHYVEHQLVRLHLPSEGLREGLLALTIMLTGRLLGDKAMLSSAASLGGTVAGSVYLGQQGWWGAFWASWFGVPAWVSWVGIGSGVLSALLLSPLLAPGVEWGMNRLRARRVLQQTVQQAKEKLTSKDGVLLASRLGVYLQLLPDLAQFLARLKS